MKEAKGILHQLQAEKNSLLEEGTELKTQVAMDSSNSEDLLSKYKALFESYKQSGVVIKELVDDGKKGVQELRPQEGSVTLSTATLETLRDGVKHNASILSQKRKELELKINKHRSHEVWLDCRTLKLERTNQDLRQQVHGLEYNQATRMNAIIKLEEEVKSRDNCVQTLMLEQTARLQEYTKPEEKLGCKNDQLDKAACGTLASIAVLDDLKKSNDVLKKKVKTLQCENTLWDFLLEHSVAVDKAKGRGFRWLSSEAAWKRAQDVATRINERHKSCCILH